MGTPTSIFQLRRKRNEIRDAIASYEVKLREARADLAAVLSTLRLFEVTGDPADLTPYMDLNRLFRRGETTELCLAALQEEGELDTRELTARVMAAKGLDASDKVLFQAIALRVVQTLRVRAIRGKQIDGSKRRRGVCLWRLTSADAAANSPSTDATPAELPPASRFPRIAFHSLPGGDLRATPFPRRTR